jgi:hypothetical protein
MSDKDEIALEKLNVTPPSGQRSYEPAGVEVVLYITALPAPFPET